MKNKNYLLSILFTFLIVSCSKNKDAHKEKITVSEAKQELIKLGNWYMMEIVNDSTEKYDMKNINDVEHFFENMKNNDFISNEYHDTLYHIFMNAINRDMKKSSQEINEVINLYKIGIPFTQSALYPQDELSELYTLKDIKSFYISDFKIIDDIAKADIIFSQEKGDNEKFPTQSEINESFGYLSKVRISIKKKDGKFKIIYSPNDLLYSFSD